MISLKAILLIIGLAFSSLAHTSAMIRHKGVVKSYDATYVRLLTKKGEVRIPKRYLDFETRSYLHEFLAKEISVSFPLQDLKHIKYARNFK